MRLMLCAVDHLRQYALYFIYVKDYKRVLCKTIKHDDLSVHLSVGQLSLSSSRGRLMSSKLIIIIIMLVYYAMTNRNAVQIKYQ